MQKAQKILYDLYRGEICPIAHPAPASEEYKTLLEKHKQSEADLLQKIDYGDHALYMEARDMQNTICAMDEQAAFVYGFRMGAKMMLACLQGE